MIVTPKILKATTCNHPSDQLIFIRNVTTEEKRKNVKYRSIWFCNHCHSIVYRNRVGETGKISDGYHTFDELYHHRAILTAVICHDHPEICWKSLKHHDGTMYDGMFIVGIETPEGTATYHYDTNPYWFMFNVKELPFAPEWDGHTPDDAIKRISSLLREKPKKVNIQKVTETHSCKKPDRKITKYKKKSFIDYILKDR